MKLYLPLLRSDFKDNSFILDKRPLYIDKKSIDKKIYKYYTLVEFPNKFLSKLDNYYILTYKKKIYINKLNIELFENIKYKPIPNYSKYLALETGEILNLKTGNRTKGVTAGHYLKVNMIADDEITGNMRYVHKIIALALYGEQPNKVVMHINENRFDNRFKNLKYGTQSENVKASYKHRYKNKNLNENNKKRIITMENIHIINDLPYTDSLDLQVRADMLSFEDNMFTKTYNYVSTKLKAIPNLLFNVTNKIDDIGFSFKIEHVRDLKKFNKNSKSFNKKINFIDVEDRLTPVVLGLDVKYIKLSHFLADNSKTMIDDLLPMLKSTNKMLANTLSNPEYSKSFRDTGKLYKKQEEKLNSIKDEMVKIINPNKVIDRLPVKDVINSLSETTDISDILLKAVKDYDGKKLGEAKKLTLEITEKVDVLIKMMENNEIEMSKESLKGLIANIELSANLLTINTQLYYLFVQQIDMLCRLEDVITKKKKERR